MGIHAKNSFDTFASTGFGKSLIDLFKGIEANQFVEGEHALAVVVQQFRNKQLGNGLYYALLGLTQAPA